MMKLALSVVALIAVIAAMFAPSFVGRAQSATRFEYGRVAPYSVSQADGRVVYLRVGYRACVAATDEWTCRDFGPQESSDAALRTALATLGNEGWELVSTPNANSSVSADALTYLFKRQRQ